MSSGNLDTTFGTGGTVITNIGNNHDVAKSVTIQSDGKIVVAGSSVNGIYSDFAMVRYNTDGSLDTSFGNGGKVTSSIGNGNDFGMSVAIESNGKIVVAGYSDSSKYNFAMIRYNTNGSIDPCFGINGKVTTVMGSGNDYSHSVATQSDGKSVVAGYSFNGRNYDFAVVRYNTIPIIF